MDSNKSNSVEWDEFIQCILFNVDSDDNNIVNLIIRSFEVMDPDQSGSII